MPATTEYFYAQKRGKYNVRSICKICWNEYLKAWQKTHKLNIAAIQKKHHDSENYKEKRKEYREVCKERIAVRQKQCQINHKIEIDEYLERTKIKRIALHRCWCKANPEKKRDYELKRRAQKLKTMISKFDIEKWFAFQPKPLRCYLCGKLIRKNEKFHIEHRIPLARGGIHAPWNLGIAHAQCNLSKHKKTPSEYNPEKFQPELNL